MGFMGIFGLGGKSAVVTGKAKLALELSSVKTQVGAVKFLMDPFTLKDKFTGLTDEHRTQLAIAIAKQYSLGVCQNFTAFKITDEKMRLKVAHEIEKKSGALLCTYLQNFKINDENELFYMAMDIAKQKEAVGPLLDNLREKFKVLKETDILKVLRLAASINAEAVSEKIDLLNIGDVDARVDIYCIAYKTDPAGTEKHKHNYKIVDDRLFPKIRVLKNIRD